MKVHSLSCVWLFATLCSLPGSSIHGIFQARTLEWVAISFSRRSSQPRDWTWVSHIVGRHFTIWPTKEVKVKQYYDLNTESPTSKINEQTKANYMKYICNYGRFTLLYSRNRHYIVIFFQLKIKNIKANQGYEFNISYISSI